MAADAAMLAFADTSFDFILCNNTLPYIREDRRALAENRALPQARRTRDDRYPSRPRRDPQRGRAPPEAPRAREEWFAANGDAWVYGEDFLGRVRDAGLDPVEMELFPGAPADFFVANGLKPRVRALFASRHRSGLRRFFGEGAGERTRVPPGSGPHPSLPAPA